MSEFKDRKHVFNRNKGQEGKSSSSGPASKQTASGTHLVNLRNAAKSMPKGTKMPKINTAKAPKMPKQQRKG